MSLPDIALLESRTLRASVATRTEVLDKVKILTLLPDGLHVTTQMVADYYEVGVKAINALIQRHRPELTSNGLRVLHDREAREFVGLNLPPTPGRGRGIAVFPRRAVLNVGMLLHESHVARAVRTHLLDSEQRYVRVATPEGADAPPRPQHERTTRSWHPGPGPHWDEWEASERDPAVKAWLRVIDGEKPAPPSRDYTAERLDDLEQRQKRHARLIGTLGADVAELRRAVNSLLS